MTQTTHHQIRIEPDGTIVGLWSDEVPYRNLSAALNGGPPEVRRASHCEPDDEGRWTADLTPSGGPVLGPFERRREALAAEVEWLRENGFGRAAAERGEES